MAAPTLPYPNPTTSGQYAEDLDVKLGAPIPVNPNALAVTSAWVQSESPTFPGWNGLGTELYLAGAKPDPSNPSVYDYPTLDEGLTAAVDMMTGSGPQTTALAPNFVADIRSGRASKQQLISDVLGSHWAGLSAPDTYDAQAIAAKLGDTAFSVSGSPSAPANATQAGVPWYMWLLNPGAAAGGAAGGAARAGVKKIAGTIGTYILKGVLSLLFAGLVVYGATLLTDREASKAVASVVPIGGSNDEGDEGDLFDDAELAA